jgi:hypothetical protein
MYIDVIKHFSESTVAFYNSVLKAEEHILRRMRAEHVARVGRPGRHK